MADATTPETTTAIVPQQQPGLLLGSLSVQADTPAATALESIEVASTIARKLADVIRGRKATGNDPGQPPLYATIKGRDYVKVEGWTTMAAMLGVVVREVVTREHPDVDGEFVSTVEAIRISDGAVLGRATHRCGAADDRPWCDRPRYARSSMALTRATGKVLRVLFSWIMPLAGYEVTPAEEMPNDDGNSGSSRAAPPKPQRSRADLLARAKAKVGDRVQGNEPAGEVGTALAGGLEAMRTGDEFTGGEIQEMRECVTDSLIAHLAVDYQRVRDMLDAIEPELTPAQVTRLTQALGAAATAAMDASSDAEPPAEMAAEAAGAAAEGQQ